MRWIYVALYFHLEKDYCIRNSGTVHHICAIKIVVLKWVECRCIAKQFTNTYFLARHCRDFSPSVISDRIRLPTVLRFQDEYRILHPVTVHRYTQACMRRSFRLLSSFDDLEREVQSNAMHVWRQLRWDGLNDKRQANEELKLWHDLHCRLSRRSSASLKMISGGN